MTQVMGTGNALGPQTPQERQQQSCDMRMQAVSFYKHLDIPVQESNGDEEDYKSCNYYANYTKGLQHDEIGEVTPDDYHALLRALESGLPEDFERVQLGEMDPNATKLINPQAGLAFDTEGIDSHLLALPPAPTFNSAEEIGEIAENYWMALARDIPFVEYDSNSITRDAAEDLSQYAVFTGPKEGNMVTTHTLFRGFTADDVKGPYLSQFLLHDIPYGSQLVKAGLTFVLPNQNYMTTPDEWLAVQRGQKPQDVPQNRIQKLAEPRLIASGRDLAQYVHIDELFQAYLNACLLLITPKNRGGLEAPLDEGNPYGGYIASLKMPRASNQTGFGTLGEPNFKTLVAEVATRALKTVWYQKWFVHRRLRPEVFAGRIHHHKAGHRQYDFHPTEFAKLEDTVLGEVLVKNDGNSYLLPMAFPEGSPQHPAYGAGHATVAGACVTVLKALFYEDATFTKDLDVKVKMPSSDGKSLPMEYTGCDKDQITVGGELNKLAANVGLARNVAGVHWRSDYTESMKLGEKVALYFLQEYVQTYNEHVSFSITRFDGSRVTISKQQVF